MSSFLPNTVSVKFEHFQGISSSRSPLGGLRSADTAAVDRHPIQYGRSAMNRFNEKVDKSSDCWEWKGSTATYGYGTFWYEGKQHRAHRIAWLLKHGEFPPDYMAVCHSCDNRSCVKPDHLFIGSGGENNLDRQIKGRSKGLFESGKNHISRRVV